MKGRRRAGCLALGALLLTVVPATARERSVNERHPVRLGDISFLAAGPVIVPRDMSARGTFPLDLPTTTLVGDIFVDQARTRGESTTIGFELGARQRLAPWLALDVGVGTDAVGPVGRALVFATVGLSATFSGSGR